MHPFVPSLAQPVLDLFPDVVSQFGLLGCGASLVILAVPLALCAHAVWSAFKPAPRRAEWRYDRVSAQPSFDERLKADHERTFREWPQGSAPRVYGRITKAN